MAFLLGIIERKKKVEKSVQNLNNNKYQNFNMSDFSEKVKRTPIQKFTRHPLYDEEVLENIFDFSDNLSMTNDWYHFPSKIGDEVEEVDV